MKSFINAFGLMAMLFAMSCVTQKNSRVIVEEGSEKDDTAKYELLVTEPGFHTWYLTHSRPEWYHSETYYENWNRQYVIAWNNKAGNPLGNVFFSEPINYDFKTDYNPELDHELFYYFQFVEKKLGYQILANGPKNPIP